MPTWSEQSALVMKPTILWDNYDTEFQDDGSKRKDEEEMDDLWKDEEELYFAGTPEAF
jgi:hypothetical protein